MDTSSILSVMIEVPVFAFKVTIAIGLARLALTVLNSLSLTLFYNLLAVFQKPKGGNNGSN